MNYYLTEIQYFGTINLYFDLICQTNLYFSSTVLLDKALHVNRTPLMGANGPLLLTVPLLGGRDKKQKFRDTRISYSEPWQRIHWKSIHDAYRKAPWFEDYAPGLEELIKTKEEFLIDLNLKTMQWAFQKLKLNIDILSVEEAGIRSGLQNPSATNNENSPVSFSPYPQVFSERHGFVPNLSILDLLLCEGPSAKKYLEKRNHF